MKNVIVVDDCGSLKIFYRNELNENGYLWECDGVGAYNFDDFDIVA